MALSVATHKHRDSRPRVTANNFYDWDSEDAAIAFFTDQLLEQVAGLYGLRGPVNSDGSPKFQTQN